jgi:hypothetical protein
VSVRGKLEVGLVKQIDDAGYPVRYEKDAITYDEPPAKYKPDFRLPNGIIVEGKGWFQPSDRRKHLLIKQQHPHLDIRFVFDNPNSRIAPGSQSTNAMWADKHGFQWAKKLIPEAWFKESSK